MNFQNLPVYNKIYTIYHILDIFHIWCIWFEAFARNKPQMRSIHAKSGYTKYRGAQMVNPSLPDTSVLCPNDMPILFNIYCSQNTHQDYDRDNWVQSTYLCKINSLNGSRFLTICILHKPEDGRSGIDLLSGKFAMKQLTARICGWWQYNLKRLLRQMNTSS